MKLLDAKAICEAATPGPWVARLDGWTIRAYPDARLAADGIKVATTCLQFIQGQGTNPDVQQQIDNQEFIAFFNPTLVAKLLTLWEAADRVKIRHDMDEVDSALADLENEP